MKTTVVRFGEAGLTLEEWADKHEFEMLVTERSRRAELDGKQLPRYTAKFVNVEVLEGNMLASTYGSGSTPDEAIKDYALRIEGKRVVHRAMHKMERLEVDVPNHLPLEDEETRLADTRWG